MKAFNAVAACAAVGFLGFALACGGDRGSAGGSTSEAGGARGPIEGPRVWITTPAEGDTIPLGGVRVAVNVDGVKIVPAKMERVEGEGHLHLFMDRDVTRAEVPIPMDPTIVHLGNGASEWIFSSMGPGQHRVIVVFAYGDHVPATNVRTDTVNFVVR